MEHLQNRPPEEQRQDVIEGLVLCVEEYKDQCGIIKVALPERIVSIYARGIMKETSKNRRLSNPFSKVRLVYDPKYSRDMLYLIHGNVIWYGFHINENLLAQSICFVLRDLILKNGMTPLVYEELERTWNAWNQNDETAGYCYSCALMASMIKLAGIAPEIDFCIHCHSKKEIQLFSIEEGGFVCRNCNQSGKRMKKDTLRKIRALFRVQLDSLDLFEKTFTYNMQDFLLLCEWYQYQTDIQLPSLKFLKTVADMEKRTGN